MQFEFWGVRGSIAAAGSRTVRYGGNTTCFEVETADGVFIIDAGSGIRALGARLRRDEVKEAHILFTHCHWDHIQGIPFFSPLYDGEFTAHLCSVKETLPSEALREVLRSQMTPPTFPVPWDVLRATTIFKELSGNHIMVGQTKISWVELNHPDLVVAYRFESGGRSVVFATDIEHPESGADPRLGACAKGADVLAYDAQYTPEEYERCRGFGHSTWTVGVKVAQLADVGQLILTHHDPGHDDLFLDELQAKAQAELPGTTLAREGNRMTLEEGS